MRHCWRDDYDAWELKPELTEYRLVTETLHLKHLRAVMGISMGGMQTFECTVDYPDFMDLAIPIVGLTQPTSYDLLLWNSEEDAIRTNRSGRAAITRRPRWRRWWRSCRLRRITRMR